MSDQNSWCEAVTRKPDDDAGKTGSAAVGGGRQTGEQAAPTDPAAVERTDAERRREGRRTDGRTGRGPTPAGGSSSGHSDQVSASNENEKAARGHHKVGER